jgi:hypothetical protein
VFVEQRRRGPEFFSFSRWGMFWFAGSEGLRGVCVRSIERGVGCVSGTLGKCDMDGTVANVGRFGS